MGCHFRKMIIGGNRSREQVRALFEAAQDDDRYENGHSYSGGFGMARGLSFVDQVFYSRDDAETWLEENAQKWQEALCVKVRDGTYVIGANCAC